MKKKIMALTFIIFLLVIVLTLIISTVSAKDNKEGPDQKHEERMKQGAGPGYGPGSGQNHGAGIQMDWGFIWERFLDALTMKDVQEKLDMKKNQIDEIETLVNDAQKKNFQLKADKQAAGLDIKIEMKKDKIDISKLDSLINKAAESETKLSKNLLVAVAKALNILSSDQRKKLEDLIKEKTTERFEKWKGSRGNK